MIDSPLPRRKIQERQLVSVRKFIRSKLVQLVCVVFLMSCIIVTGTYAWSDFAGRSTRNPLTVNGSGVALTDYSGELGEIYAVNYGQEPAVLRVKLLQYLEVAGRPAVPGALAEDPSTWATADSEAIGQYYRLILGRAVLTMEEWRARGAPQGDYWVEDTDGWFYYARRLPPGEATRVLLQEIVPNQFRVLTNGDFRLQSVLQAVKKSDLPGLLALEKGSFSEDGRRLMGYVSGEMIEFVQEGPT